MSNISTNELRRRYRDQLPDELKYYRIRADDFKEKQDIENGKNKIYKRFTPYIEKKYYSYFTDILDVDDFERTGYEFDKNNEFKILKLKGSDLLSNQGLEIYNKIRRFYFNKYNEEKVKEEKKMSIENIREELRENREVYVKDNKGYIKQKLPKINTYDQSIYKYYKNPIYKYLNLNLEKESETVNNILKKRGEEFDDVNVFYIQIKILLFESNYENFYYIDKDNIARYIEVSKEFLDMYIINPETGIINTESFEYDNKIIYVCKLYLNEFLYANNLEIDYEQYKKNTEEYLFYSTFYEIFKSDINDKKKFVQNDYSTLKINYNDYNDLEIKLKKFYEYPSLRNDVIENHLSYVRIGSLEFDRIFWIEDYFSISIPADKNPETKKDFSDKKKFSSYIKELKAFNNVKSQYFQSMTEISTYEYKNCIYQTFAEMYIEKGILSKKDKKERVNALLIKENENIQRYVKNGELLEFLLEKSLKVDETFYVQILDSNYYDKNIIDISDGSYPEYENLYHMGVDLYDIGEGKLEGFKVKNNEFFPIYDLREFNEKKVMLWYSNHVGIRSKIIYDTKHKEIKKDNYSLRPIKQTTKQRKTLNKYITFDFETRNYEDGKQKGFCLCLYTKGKLLKSFYGDNIENEFIEYLDSIVVKSKTTKTNLKIKTTYYNFYGFNNANFDNLLFFEELKCHDNNIDYIVAGSSIKYLQYHNITFYDLHLFYPGSLESVGESFGLKCHKGVFPYKFPNKDNLYYNGKVPELKYWKSEENYNEYIKENGENFNMKEYTLKYCELDTKITYQILLCHLSLCDNFAKMIGKENVTTNFKNCMTSAGMSLKIFQSCFQEYDLFQSPEKILLHERESYFGGRTELFKKYGGKLYYFDINSSYPFSMTFTMPYKYIRTIALNDPIIYNKENINKIKSFYLYKVESEYKGNNKFYIPNLLHRMKNNKIVAMKNCPPGYKWGCEIISAIKDGCEIKCYEINEYEGERIFENFSKELYDLRLKYKKNQPLLATFIKNVLNSLYGKFGQNLTEQTIICNNIDELFKIYDDKKKYVKDIKFINDNLISVKVENEKMKEQSIGKLVRFSSYIAALSRTNLSNFMRDVGHEHVYYCDTDSVFIDINPAELNIKQIDNDGNERNYIDQKILGCWKNESKKIQKYDKKTNKELYKESIFLKVEFEGEIIDSEILVPDCDEVLVVTKRFNAFAPKSYNFEVSIPENTDEKSYYKIKEIIVNAMKGIRSEDITDEKIKELIEGKTVKFNNDSMFFRKVNGVTIKAQERSISSVLNKRIWNGNNSEAFETIEEYEKNNY